MNVELEKLKEKCEICRACDLSKTRKNVVFSDGTSAAPIMLIGEAPGASEDIQALPFVGRSGQLLRKMFSEEGMDSSGDLYITNIVKCRPPLNRLPDKIEKDTCKPFLLEQIELIKPQIIVCVGATATKEILSGKEPISAIRGRWFDGFNAKIMPIFHPSYLLRNPSDYEGSPKNLMREDIKEIKKMKDSLFNDFY